MRQAGGVSSGMLACGTQEIARWDTRLNVAYRTLLARATADGRTGLRAEQRAWLGRHRARTRRLAEAPDNGSVAFLESQAFELADLQQRTEALERRAKPPARPRP